VWFDSTARKRPKPPKSEYVNPNRLTTIYLVGDTHYGTNNLEVGDANERQIVALKSMPGKAHPLGGTIKAPDAVIQLGDAIHEATDTTARFSGDYRLDGTGDIPWPCYVVDGNHDQNQVRDMIRARHGSLTWGKKIGEIYYQAMTENYTAENNTTPPTVAQVAAADALLAARPAAEKKIIMLHRALSGGYPAEWDATALTNFDTMVAARGVVAVLHGHDHYSQHFTRSGYRVFSPGSVTQSPFDQSMPYQTTYPESFIILRTGYGWYDVASYLFGFNVNRVWAPGTWEWSERVHF